MGKRARKCFLSEGDSAEVGLGPHRPPAAITRPPPGPAAAGPPRPPGSPTAPAEGREPSLIPADHRGLRASQSWRPRPAVAMATASPPPQSAPAARLTHLAPSAPGPTRRRPHAAPRPAPSAGRRDGIGSLSFPPRPLIGWLRRRALAREFGTILAMLHTSRKGRGPMRSAAPAWWGWRCVRRCVSGRAVRGPKFRPSCSRGLLPLRGLIFSSSSLELPLCSVLCPCDGVSQPARC